VLVTVFSSIENGIYTAIRSSAALFLIRVAHPRGYFLGKVTLHADSQDHKGSREVFVPLKPDGVTNPQVKVDAISPGVIIYRLEESFVYPNSSLVNGALVDHVKSHTQRGKDMTNVKPADRAWNDPGPGRHGAAADQEINELKPILHAIILDFSAMYVVESSRV
jgi:sodium-independent sulfate anion transporter 11